MKKTTQNITKLPIAAFLMLQCAVCFAADFSIDSTVTSAIFIEENVVIAGVDNIFVAGDCVFTQCGCLTDFAANSPPCFI